MSESKALLEIELITDDRLSRATADRLRELVAQHEVSAWLYTRRVAIDLRAIPHSHPVLTLHTRHLGQDHLLLATFLHEQLHWFVGELADVVLEDLRELFPVVPVGFPEGCSDEGSTYLHLIVNYLEMLVLRVVLGDGAARSIIEHWSTDHYCWVYRTVRERESDLRDLVLRHNLLPSGVAV